MEDKNYKELTEFIGGQFNKVWTEFDKVHKQFDRVWDEFDKTHAEFRNIYREHAELKNDFRDLQTSVDAYATQSNTYFLEMTALGSKLKLIN